MNDMSKEKIPDSKDDTVSVVNSNLEKQYSNRYKFADFDKMYNPYKVSLLLEEENVNFMKVRQEIEKKYQQGRTNSSGKTLSRGTDSASRLKLIEKNFFN